MITKFNSFGKTDILNESFNKEEIIDRIMQHKVMILSYIKKYNIEKDLLLFLQNFRGKSVDEIYEILKSSKTLKTNEGYRNSIKEFLSGIGIVSGIIVFSMVVLMFIFGVDFDSSFSSGLYLISFFLFVLCMILAAKLPDDPLEDDDIIRRIYKRFEKEGIELGKYRTKGNDFYYTLTQKNTHENDPFREEDWGDELKLHISLSPAGFYICDINRTKLQVSQHLLKKIVKTLEDVKNEENVKIRTRIEAQNEERRKREVEQLRKQL